MHGGWTDMLGLWVLWVLPAFFTSQGVVGLASRGAWPGRGIVLCGGLVAALTGPTQGPGSADGEDETGCQTSALQNFNFSTSSIQVQLPVEPDTMKGSGLIPPIQLSIRHEVLKMGGHLLPDEPLLSIHHDQITFNEEGY